MSTLKVSKIQHLGSSGNGFVFDEKGTVGIGTRMDTNVVGAASSKLDYTLVMVHYYSVII